jgi:predicted DCC family thiol-disulfide oxidoreductase YuxK
VANHEITNSPNHEITAVILFDGVCNLCNGFVQFVIARDPARRFQFASLQSDAAQRRLEGADIAADVPDSIVLLEEGRLFTRSTAALRIARRLRFPWSLAFALIAIPRPVRDGVYNLVARNRYRWFGTRETCMIPTPELEERFL